MVPFKSINFICYDLYLAYLLRIPGKEGITNRDRLIGGGISGAVATVLCIPLDTVRIYYYPPQKKEDSTYLLLYHLFSGMEGGFHLFTRYLFSI